MKNFKFSLSILTMLFALFILQSCNEQQEVITTVTEQSLYPQVESYVEVSPDDFQELSEFVRSGEYVRFMNEQSFSAVKFYKYMTDTKDSFFGIKIHNNDLTSNAELFVYPEKYDIPAIIIETNTTLEGEAISVIKMQGYTPIYNGIMGQNNLGDRHRNCYQTTSGFLECASCALNVLSGDLLSWLACEVAPESCLAAVAIHCSGATSN